MSDNKLFTQLEASVKQSCQIESDLFEKFDVKRGLRNADGTGVLVGLTKIGEVQGYKKEGDKLLLFLADYCTGESILKILLTDFRKTTGMVLMKLSSSFSQAICPQRCKLKEFSAHIASLRSLPDDFTKDMILSMKGKDVLNILARSVLGLYTLDEKPDSTPLIT